MTFTPQNITTYILASILLLNLFSCEKESNSTSEKPLLVLKSKTKSTNSSLNSDRLIFDYNASERILNITHQNTAFNCKSDVNLEFKIKNDQIIIEEKESNAQCSDLSLFDISFQLKNLPEKKYTIKIIEPYVNISTEKLEFEIDLTELEKGAFELQRNFYPWGK